MERKKIILLSGALAAFAVAGGIWFLVNFASVEEYLPQYQGAVEGDRFIHEGLGFSFALPEGFKVQQLPYGEGFELIAVEKSPTEGFQISITPFDEMHPLTPERILVDLPDKVINQPTEAALGGEPALVFNSRDQDVGDTFEVWFPHEGHLYQILTYRRFAAELSRVLDSWKFK